MGTHQKSFQGAQASPPTFGSTHEGENHAAQTGGLRVILICAYDEVNHDECRFFQLRVWHSVIKKVINPVAFMTSAGRDDEINTGGENDDKATEIRTSANGFYEVPKGEYPRFSEDSRSFTDIQVTQRASLVKSLSSSISAVTENTPMGWLNKVKSVFQKSADINSLTGDSVAKLKAKIGATLNRDRFSSFKSGSVYITVISGLSDGGIFGLEHGNKVTYNF